MFSGSYVVPFFENAMGFRKQALDGWRVNTIFTAQSGAPFTVNLGVDQANIGSGPAQRPDQLRDPNLPGGERTPDRWFDTDAFALPAQFTFGDGSAKQRDRTRFCEYGFVCVEDLGTG